MISSIHLLNRRIKLATRKDRRNSGWTYPLLILKAPRDFIINNCLEPERFWDDWIDWRDCARQLKGIDSTKTRKRKQRKLKLRRARKHMKKLTEK